MFSSELKCSESPDNQSKLNKLVSGSSRLIQLSTALANLTRWSDSDLALKRSNWRSLWEILSCCQAVFQFAAYFDAYSMFDAYPQIETLKNKRPLLMADNVRLFTLTPLKSLLQKGTNASNLNKLLVRCRKAAGNNSNHQVGHIHKACSPVRLFVRLFIRLFTNLKITI